MNSAWTDLEITILRQLYPQGGAAACRPYLPGRSNLAICKMAAKQGIRFERSHFSSFIEWPETLASGVPLRDAIIGEFANIRNHERITSAALDTLKHVIHYNRMPSLATVIEAAELLGLDLQNRDGWLEFANRVANRLPKQEVSP